MRNIFILLFSVVSCIANSLNTNLNYLQQIPTLRAEALRKAKPTGSDSTSDIYTKNDVYYENLKTIINNLRSKFYFHKEFPADIMTALEQHAVVLAGIQYPLSPNTGCSGYDAILVDNKIMLAESMLGQMVDSIYRTEYWDSNKAQVSKQGLEFIKIWHDRWNASKAK